jgi:broad specificity polyphosphatase/5'/3'-nucleotidase SurE
VRGLAVSIAWATEPDFWETAVDLACGIVPVLADAEPATVLNLNVPAVRPHELKGLRHGRLGKVGLIRSVRPEHTPMPVEGRAVDRTGGAIVLSMRGMSEDPDRLKERSELEPDSDAALVENGWASLTPLVGVREGVTGDHAAALAAALASRRQ